MSEDTLQWIAIIFLGLWMGVMSSWISETTELLKSWWSDFLVDMIKDEYRRRVSKVKGPAFCSQLERIKEPKPKHKWWTWDGWG